MVHDASCFHPHGPMVLGQHLVICMRRKIMGVAGASSTSKDVCVGEVVHRSKGFNVQLLKRFVHTAFQWVNQQTGGFRGLKWWVHQQTGAWHGT
jgi:hypothetical protein